MEEQNKEVTIKMVKDSNYRVVYANGVYGGIGPSGELRFDLFQDFREFPEEEYYFLTEDGHLGDKKGQNPEVPDLVRLRKIGVIIPAEKIPDIVKWLNEKYKIWIETFGKKLVSSIEQDAH